MKEPGSSSILKVLKPYFVIACAGILAFAPVSFMLRSLKNDILVLDYPIKYFMSQCIHNGEIPYWFNTWGMGFPLQSNLTWGIFSTPQILFSSLFNYNIYTLHIEFIFYVLLAGWSMFYLLKKHFLQNETIALVLACCYMLSGFVTGSSQWPLNITTAAFVPVILNALLQLLKSPSLRSSFFFAVLYFLMFTSIYAAHNIIIAYGLSLFTVYWIIKNRNDKTRFIKTVRYLAFACVLTIIFCLPCFLSTLEVLRYMDRGNPIAGNLHFFNSNYLPPSGLLSMFIPLTSVRMSFPNTEGTMFNSYAGIFTLLLLPIASINIIKQKRWNVFLLAVAALFFLLVSFGGILPVRSFLNILPGFSYFRNAGIFRFYFILLIILFLASYLSDKNWKEIFNISANNRESSKIKWMIILLLLIFLISFFSQAGSFRNFSFASMTDAIKNISFPVTIIINSIIQLFFLGLLLISILKKKYGLLKTFFIAELVVNTFLCTPYFTVSSYSLPSVNHILHSTKGFPIQSESLIETAASFTDNKNNDWSNVNIFQKKISGNISYLGPLKLKGFSLLMDDSSKRFATLAHPPVFIEGNAFNDSSVLKIVTMRPSYVSAEVNLLQRSKITLLQNYFPGWKAYYNNSKVELIDKEKPGLTIDVPAGKGIIDFRYERKTVWIAALLLHLITISFLVYCIAGFVKRIFFKPSSPS